MVAARSSWTWMIPLVVVMTVLSFITVQSHGISYMLWSHLWAHRTVPKLTNPQKVAVLWQMLTDVTRACSTSATPVWCQYGTLLGLVRTQHLICYDYDLDLAAESKHFAAISAALKQRLSQPQYQVVILDLPRLRFIQIIHRQSHLRCDINFYRATGTGESATYHKMVPFPQAKDTVPGAVFFPLQSQVIRGVQLWFPHQPASWLETEYGKTWRTPHQLPDVCD